MMDLLRLILAFCIIKIQNGLNLIQWYRPQNKAAVVTSVSGAGGNRWCRILRQPVAPQLARRMLLKILPWVKTWHQVSAILALVLTTAIISGQQQRRVIGFDADGRITIQVQ